MPTFQAIWIQKTTVVIWTISNTSGNHHLLLITRSNLPLHLFITTISTNSCSKQQRHRHPQVWNHRCVASNYLSKPHGRMKSHQHHHPKHQLLFLASFQFHTNRHTVIISTSRSNLTEEKTLYSSFSDRSGDLQAPTACQSSISSSILQ